MRFLLVFAMLGQLVLKMHGLGRYENDTSIIKILLTIIRDPEFQTLQIEQQRGVFFAMYTLLENHLKKIKNKKNFGILNHF
jgi:hypothetical protein